MEEREKATTKKKYEETHLPMLLKVFLFSILVYSWLKIGSPISLVNVCVRVCVCAVFSLLLLLLVFFSTLNKNIVRLYKWSDWRLFSNLVQVWFEYFTRFFLLSSLYFFHLHQWGASCLSGSYNFIEQEEGHFLRCILVKTKKKKIKKNIS